MDSAQRHNRENQLALLLPRFGASTNIRDVDYTHLEYFRLYTVKELPGCDWGVPWSNITLFSGLQESPVTRATVALGAIHRKLMSRPSNINSLLEDKTKISVDILDSYQQAVVPLRAFISNVQETTLVQAQETTLVTILLL